MIAGIWTGDDLILTLVCAGAVLIAVVFFVTIYVGVFVQWRRKVEQKKAMERVARKLAPRSVAEGRLQEKKSP